MRFDLHLRRSVTERLHTLAERMGAWEHQPRLSNEERARVRSSIRSFSHTTRVSDTVFAGVDGSGDYPSITYADSFVYLSVASTAVFEADAVSGLREVATAFEPVAEFTWLPGDHREATRQWDEAFATLSGRSIAEVIESSDYRVLKERETGRKQPAGRLAAALLRPRAADAGNVAIQLRSTAEMGAALRLLSGPNVPQFLLVDGTLSLPMVSRDEVSLFYEHVKRLCAAQARRSGCAFIALSKSHGLPGIEDIEQLAAEALGVPARAAEHWFARLPTVGDGWELSLLDGRGVPPPGAVSYLVRFHQTTPVLRLDLDRAYWEESLRGATESETAAAEASLFERLDYACHDQRCFGYPYPIKAGHDRASLTEPERVALRKQVIDSAVAAGMSRRLFRSAAVATGHG